MRLARPRDVPITAGASGVVLVIALFNYGGPDMFRNLGILFGAWGLMYLVECGWYAVSRRTSPQVSGTLHAGRPHDGRPADRRPGPTVGE
jgi:hypothetical protein